MSHQKIDSFNQIPRIHFCEVSSSLVKVKRKLKEEVESEYRPPTFFGEEIKMSSGEIEASLEKALEISTGWHCCG